MKVELIEGDTICSSGKTCLNGIWEEDGVCLGYCYVEYLQDKSGKAKRTNKIIKLVRQGKWYLYIPIFIHEYAHYLLDFIFPYNFDRAFKMHGLVEFFLNFNLIFNIDRYERKEVKKCID